MQYSAMLLESATLVTLPLQENLAYLFIVLIIAAVVIGGGLILCRLDISAVAPQPFVGPVQATPVLWPNKSWPRHVLPDHVELVASEQAPRQQRPRRQRRDPPSAARPSALAACDNEEHCLDNKA